MGGENSRMFEGGDVAFRYLGGVFALIQGTVLHVLAVAGRLLEMELNRPVKQFMGRWYQRVR